MFLTINVVSDHVGGRGRFRKSVVGSIRFGLGFPIFVFCFVAEPLKGVRGTSGAVEKNNTRTYIRLTFQPAHETTTPSPPAPRYH